MIMPVGIIMLMTGAVVDFFNVDYCITHYHVYTNEKVKFRTDVK
jgi:hypothetical protein